MKSFVPSLVRLRFAAALALALAPLALACAAPPLVPLGPAPGVTVSGDATAGLVEHHRFHHHGGITLLIAMSLDTLSVSAEQQPAVDRIRASLRTAMSAARAFDQALLETLAKGIASTNLDMATVEAELAQSGAASASVFAASAHALDELRGVLTPAQRSALFEKVSWHWTIWQHANGETDADNSDIATIVTNLGLTTDQGDRIAADVAARLKQVKPLDLAEVTASVRALGEEFQAHDFDAQTIAAVSVADQHMAAWGSARLVAVVEAAMQVLDDGQRTALSRALREHAHDSAMGSGRR
jgi:Spy/CpxP family protein refolding chaperone